MAQLYLASFTFAAMLGHSYLGGRGRCPGFPLDYFGFSLQPIVERMPFVSTALFVQFVRTIGRSFPPRQRWTEALGPPPSEESLWFW